MKLNGSQIVMACLKEHGVDTVFGYPGGAVLNIYDALEEEKEMIRHILTAHEQGAAHAADGYARATGKVGVCIATSGPGATNLVTGIATAYMDSVPLVAITGNVGTPLLGKDSFQEIDITGVTMPITKHNYIVKEVEKLADTLREAFYIAASGRPGPVLVDIPKDITVALCEYTYKEPLKVTRQVNSIRQKHIDQVVNLIKKSEKPFVIAGGGIIASDAHEELLQFAELIQAPVSTTLMGLGAFPETHRLATSLIGMHGSRASNMAVSHCDLLIAIGTRFSDRVTSSIATFAPQAQIVHIDIDPAEIGKNRTAHTSITGDAKEVLGQLCRVIHQQEHTSWLEKVRSWDQDYPFQYQNEATLQPQFIIKTIDEKTQGKAIITTEVGQHQMWAAQFYRYTRPRTFISSGGLGTMGYGTGASIGAQLASPNQRVVHIAGDGSFRMNCNELATMAYYHVPVIIIIMNNTTLGMVRQWQTMFYNERYAQTTLDRGPDFVKLADAYGVTSYKVTTQEMFQVAFDKALEEKGPVVLDCHIAINEKVLPMVAPGAPVNQLILE